MPKNDIPELKKYKNSKNILANMFDVSGKVIQRAIDDVITYAVNNGNTISSTNLVSLAEAPGTLLHDAFDWDGTQQEREMTADMILGLIEYVVAGNGKLYKITAQ